MLKVRDGATVHSKSLPFINWCWGKVVIHVRYSLLYTKHYYSTHLTPVDKWQLIHLPYEWSAQVEQLLAPKVFFPLNWPVNEQPWWSSSSSWLLESISLTSFHYYEQVCPGKVAIICSYDILYCAQTSYGMQLTSVGKWELSHLPYEWSAKVEQLLAPKVFLPLTVMAG